MLMQGVVYNDFAIFLLVLWIIVYYTICNLKADSSMAISYTDLKQNICVTIKTKYEHKKAYSLITFNKIQTNSRWNILFGITKMKLEAIKAWFVDVTF